MACPDWRRKYILPQMPPSFCMALGWHVGDEIASDCCWSWIPSEDQLGRTKLVDVMTGGRRRLELWWLRRGESHLPRRRALLRRQWLIPRWISPALKRMQSLLEKNKGKQHFIYFKKEVVEDVADQTGGVVESMADHADTEKTAYQGSLAGISE
ncbi:unnamed protein product [Prunus armeniaca]